MNYYNEHDPKAAAWLRELITQGLIPAGTVDERSITEIQPHELSEYTQCHFFAGIGGWSLALELAGWPATRPVWTGSCPCQPFSGAGEGKGASDDRHLWPVFRRLIAELHPERVFGEQVAQAIGFNWLDGVSADLETDGYAVGAVVLGAHSVGAPHIRQRLFWMADSCCQRVRGRIGGEDVAAAGERKSKNEEREWLRPDAGNALHGMGHANLAGQQGCDGPIDLELLRTAEPFRSVAAPSISDHWGASEKIRCRDGKDRRFEPGSFPLAHGLPGRVGLLRGYGNAIVPQTAAAFIEACQEVTA